jgi:succinoglycan biosynthesis protein ExoL
LRIAYLVHNLADPAVGKRLRMLTAQGDSAIVIGFHRDTHLQHEVEGVPVIDLGQTFDLNLSHRAAVLAKECLQLRNWARRLSGCDVIIARNLEMLVLAVLARQKYAPRAAVVYECLDVHRIFLFKGALSAGMRAVERLLMRRADLLIVSSPAFLREYFEPFQRLNEKSLPTLVVENKLLPTRETGAPPLDREFRSPPWRIGWFGMIRCRKSLDYLCDLSRRRPGLIDVTIRGRPTRPAFADFDAQVERTPGISYGGAYRPEELRALYGSMHFNWAIDYFEEGANSRWLLPNRIYEGGAFASVPIALRGTETARWLARLGIGVCLDGLGDLEEFLRRLTPERYCQLRRACEAVPRSAFVAGMTDCGVLRETLQGAVARRRRMDGLTAAAAEVNLGEFRRSAR